MFCQVYENSKRFYVGEKSQELGGVGDKITGNSATMADSAPLLQSQVEECGSALVGTNNWTESSKT